ncbi:MAG: cadherin-like domain-containing protein, partial [Cytophagaceae bacterium]|nr:cadherin-like domain-containing protein [Cytophagaceae bacterium]
MVFRAIVSLIIFLTLDLNYCQGQLQERFWYFGSTQYGIKFQGSPPVPSTITGKYLPFGNEGASTITNPTTGKLLFYTDGINIIDTNHLVMPNGSGLAGHSSAAQNGLACGVPGQCGKYYVFSNSSHVEGVPNGNISYSIVDMSLAGNGSVVNPMGDVVAGSKNVFVTNGSEALVLIPAFSANDYWLLSVQSNSALIKVYKITSGGIAFTNSYNTGIILQDARSIRYSEASGKFVVVSSTESDPICIADFNIQTGVISNSQIVPGTPVAMGGIYVGFYDAEWSSDGSKVYFSKYRFSPTSTGGRIYQYDLNNPLANLVLIYDVGGTYSNMGKGLKRGPDNKIYWLYVNTAFTDTRYVGVINNPDAAGVACNFDPLGFSVGNNLGNSHKFPDFLVYNNESPIANDDILLSCFSSGTVIQVLNNDVDPDNDALNITVLNVNIGSATVNGNNEIVYSPSTGFNGNINITYLVCDDNCFSLCDTAIVSLCFQCNNTAPVAVNDSVIDCVEAG